LEYDGAPFAGWQIQPGQLTVQGELTRALAVAMRHEVKVHGAGRTDAGVHALGQCASFDSQVEMAPYRLRAAVSGLCRPFITAVEAAIAPSGFHARFDALGKHYRYQLLCRAAPSPLLCATTCHVTASLDRQAMLEAAALLVGTHDFGAFRAADCERGTTTRTLSRVELVERDPVLSIEVEGDGFLKNMVRIIAGTLVDVGRGRRTVDDVRGALDTGDRDLAGITAPAHGLALVSVRYGAGWICESRASSSRGNRKL
jgi:tRNA pseudouridine38-40 synthase